MAIGGKLKSGWKRISFFDPTDGTTVQINKIAVDSTDFTEEIISADTASDRHYGGITHSLNCAFYESDGIAQLESWIKNFTAVRIVAQASGDSLLWEDPALIVGNKMPSADKRAGLSMYIISAQSHSDNPEVYLSQNLLTKLGDVDSANIVFPISGAEATFSFLGNAAGGTATLRALNYAGATLATDSAAITTGVNSLSLILPSSTYSIQVNSSAGNTSFHALTVNGQLTSGTEFMDW